MRRARITMTVGDLTDLKRKSLQLSHLDLWWCESIGIEIASRDNLRIIEGRGRERDGRKTSRERGGGTGRGNGGRWTIDKCKWGWKWLKIANQSRSSLFGSSVNTSVGPSVAFYMTLFFSFSIRLLIRQLAVGSSVEPLLEISTI